MVRRRRARDHGGVDTFTGNVADEMNVAACHSCRLRSFSPGLALDCGGFREGEMRLSGNVDTPFIVAADMPPKNSANRKPAYIASVVLIAVIVIGVALALTQPWRAFTSSTVDEAFPSAGSSVTTAPVDGTDTAEDTDPIATDKAEPAGPVEVKRGQFISLDHETSGTALIAELPDGSRVLRLEDLASLDGPDLKVVLTPASGDYSALGDAGYVTLGALKATHGNQNYAIPADLDPAAVNSVVIWCERFSSAFGAAELATI